MYMIDHDGYNVGWVGKARANVSENSISVIYRKRNPLDMFCFFPPGLACALIRRVAKP